MNAEGHKAKAEEIKNSLEKLLPISPACPVKYFRGMIYILFHGVKKCVEYINEIKEWVK